jgi:hypothetical protein
MDVSEPHLEQSALGGIEITAPTLAEVRQMFAQHIPTAGVTDEDIIFWLQAPDGKGATDKLCEIRGPRIAEKLKPADTRLVPRPRSFDTNTVISPLAKQWAGVDSTLQQRTPVLIRGPDKFIGGDKSIFSGGTSHHVILFLARGVETGSGKEFYVGFDPDISATTATRTAYDIAKGNKNSVISDMILGTGGQVLGPLCRKYYPVKTETFPKIIRYTVATLSDSD